MGLTTVWFAGGAIAALLASIAGCNIYVQAAVFLVVTIVLLIFTRPYVEKHLQKHETTNVESVPGKTGVVTEEIDNARGLGQVKIDGMEWTARSDREEVRIPAGTEIKVLSVSGVKVIVTAVSGE
jgi:membrane protein implicated in regulation of membrane protease activity